MERWLSPFDNHSFIFPWEKCSNLYMLQFLTRYVSGRWLLSTHRCAPDLIYCQPVTLQRFVPFIECNSSRLKSSSNSTTIVVSGQGLKGTKEGSVFFQQRNVIRTCLQHVSRVLCFQFGNVTGLFLRVVMKSFPPSSQTKRFFLRPCGKRVEGGDGQNGSLPIFVKRAEGACF